MKISAGLLVAALILGAATGWFLRGSRIPGNQAPNAVDTVLMTAPQVQAHVDSLLAAGSDSIVHVMDSIIQTHKDRADALATKLATRDINRRRALREQPNLPVTPTPGDTATPIVIDTTSPDTAIFLGPRTFVECREDLADRTAEAGELRQALSPCEEAKAGDEEIINSLRSGLEESQAWRNDTFPVLIAKERATPRTCTENWGLFHVKCSTSGWIKFLGGVGLGVAATR